MRFSLMRAVKAVHEAMAKPRVPSVDTGITSVWQFKWIAVLLLYAFGTGLMAKDAWFGVGEFAWNQGAFVLLLSYLVVSAVAFEWKLLGRAEGVNLILQLFLMLPVGVFLGRVLGKPSDPGDPDTLLGKAAELIGKGFTGVGLTEFIPKWIQEVFTSPGIAFFVVLVCVALSCQGKKKRVSFLCSALVLQAVFVIAYPPPPQVVFWAGAGLVAVGIYLQYLDINTIIAEENLLKRLRHVDDEMERRCAIRIAKRAIEDGSITESTVIELVRRCYNNALPLTSEEVEACARIASFRLVHEHGILDVRGSAHGIYLVPSPRLTRGESLVEELSIWPRMLILGTIAILWLVSPLDAIPDSTPVIGVLDDAVVLLAGGAPILRDLARMRRGRMGQLEANV
jgi:hypothetical protein